MFPSDITMHYRRIERRDRLHFAMQWKGNNSSIVRLTSREMIDSLHTLGSAHTQFDHRHSRPACNLSEVNLRACLDFTCVSVSHVYGSSIFDR